MKYQKLFHHFNNFTKSILIGIFSLCCLTFTIGQAMAQQFYPPEEYEAGEYPHSIAIGQLNNDGIPQGSPDENGGPVEGVRHPQANESFNMDIVTANYVGGDNVSVLLNDREGLFDSEERFAAGKVAQYVAIGYIDGDENYDLVVVNWGGHDVSVMLGYGDGSFKAAKNYDVGKYPSSVAIGDLNEDNIPDLAVTNNFDNNVLILLGKGDGVFDADKSYAVGQQPWSVAIGDLNEDSHLDLAVSNSEQNNVSILLGKGDGNFESKKSFGVGRQPMSVAIGDLNHDNHLDLAVANIYGKVSVLLGKGDGTFRRNKNYGVGALSHCVAIGDLNGDGHSDLAVTTRKKDAIAVLLGRGNGSFEAATYYDAGEEPHSVAIGELNNDTNLDLAVGRVGRGVGSGKASILLNTGWNDKLLWDVSTEVPVARVYTNSIESTEKQTFLAGLESGKTTNWNDAFSIRAYNSKTGELMWKDLHVTDDNKWDSANAIAARGNRVFAAGKVYNGDTGADFTVRAYHAITGELLWEDQYDGSAGGYDHYDQAYAIAVSGKRVFVGGKVSNDSKEWAFTVRAYHYSTGELLWEDEYDDSEGTDWVNAIAAEGNRVFAVGIADTPETGCVFAIRTYHSKTGNLLWKDQYEKGEAHAVAVKGNRVFVAGKVNNGDTGLFTARVYRASNGALLWEDQYEGDEGDGAAHDIAVSGNRVFVLGDAVTDLREDFENNSIIRAYHIKTGRLLWQQHMMGRPVFEKSWGDAITVKGNYVFVSGAVTDELCDHYECYPGFGALWTYDAKTGKLLWLDDFGDYGYDDPHAPAGVIAVSGNRIIVTCDNGLRAYKKK